MQKNINAFFSQYEFLLPLLILILFLGASLPGIEWGAPALWNPDELVWRVNNALRGELIFDETEPDWNYPSLPKYVMYVIGWLVKSTGRSEFAIIVSLRMFSAFLGALSGVLIYHIARNIGANKSVSLLAGIFYVVSGVVAENARLAHNDLYLQLFSVLCVLFVIKYQQTKNIAWLFASFFSVGLATSSKYTGGSFILLPIVIFVFEHWRQIRLSWRNIFLVIVQGGFVSYLGYAIGTPKALFSPVYYFTNVFVALRNYPQYGFNSGAPIGLFGQWSSFEDAVGIFAYYIFLFSIVWFLVRYVAWKFGLGQMEQNQAHAVFILMLAVFIFDLPFLLSINYIPRYFIPFVPFLSILAALMVYEIWFFSKQHQMKFIPPVLVVILVVGISYSTLRLVSIALLFLNDARIPATQYIATIRGYQKSIEYTLYPPDIEKRKFERAHNYPIYFVKYPNDVVPTGGRYEYNQGEQGLLERDTDYFVIDSYTYNRFFTESICVTNPIECDFFKLLLANEIETFRLVKKFTYNLPAYLPQVSVTAVNPDVLMFERIR